MATEEPPSLTGKLLVAMPGMGDTRFRAAVVFLCRHSDEGAMGLIVNKPSDEVQFEALLDQLGIDTPGDPPPIRVHFGGPVETGRGFVLHSDDYASNSSTLEIEGGFGMTATLDVLEDIAGGRGPDSAILALGYAGWGPGQLEAELQANGWLVCDATQGIVFGGPDEGKWQAALASMGVDPLMLSATGGRA